MPPLAAAGFTAFHWVGIALACWAVLLTFIGIRNPDFPGAEKGRGEKAVLAISALLAFGAISTAIGTVKGEKKEEAQAAPTKAAPAPPPPGTSQLKLSTDPTGNLKFSTDVLSAKAGNVRITLTNPSPVQHNITLQTPAGTKGGPTVGKGGTSIVTASLKPGKYVYYCSVPGHRQAGMQGELTLK